MATVDLIKVDATTDKAGTTIYTRTYKVDAKAEGDAGAVEALSALPRRFDADSSALFESAKVTERQDKRSRFDCTVTFSTAVVDGQDNNPNDPTQDAPQLSVTFRSKIKVLQVDVNGKPIQNKAGDPLVDPPIEIEDYVPVITITDKVSNADVPAAAAQIGQINSNAIFNQPPGKVRQTGHSFSRQQAANGKLYFERTREYEISDDFDPVKVLNIGFNEIGPDGLRHILIPTGEKAPDGTEVKLPINAPAPLNDAGEHSPGAPTILEFNVFKKVNI